jgi:hypothetical protein
MRLAAQRQRDNESAAVKLLKKISMRGPRFSGKIPTVLQ